ncbi:MAG: META domain-containing protein [Myxococcales bacterium]|nr:META domain-containing protein [Myxococcales bacterium]MDH3485797.1 META domain-containing protein [Myxococcales bacterium]
MRGSSKLVRFSLLGALAAAFTLSGCKKEQSSSSANDVVRQEPGPSGLMTVDGMYTYVADMGMFEDCATGEKLPVATEGDNAELERAYASSGVEPGSPLLVTVDGRLDLRRKVDGSGRDNVLIIERFVRVRPRETCGSMTPVALENVGWTLLELNGKPIVVTSEATAPYLELNATKKSAYGFGGCNRFFGSYDTAEHQALTFSAIGATRMACPKGMNQEQELLTVLGETTRYEIEGSKLLLYGHDTVVARFQARNLLKPD